jgi:hypothetical protein
VPGSSPRGIFLSYRREDAASYARLLKSELRERVPDERVFMDLDSIEPGLDFAEVIVEAVDSCAVLVALIGRQWATLADEQGRRRLDDPDDYVRFEVQAALERGVRVVPVLVDGARPLRPEQLPAELQKLARLNALELSYSRYEYDAGRLLELIERVLAAASGTGTVREALSPPDAAAPLVADVDSDWPGADALGVAAQEGPEPTRGGPGRTARLIAQAEYIAQSITDKHLKVKALAFVAQVLAATDPDRAARLIDDAVRVAQSITPEAAKAGALDTPVWVQAATDPDRAERIARSITDESWRAWVLARAAGAMAATDPDRAERAAQSITIDPKAKAAALAYIAEALAATDPDRAERAARSNTDESWKALALVWIARAMAATDPRRAEPIARSIIFQSDKARVLARIAGALAATDPARAARLSADAERAAQSITDQGSKAEVLAWVAEALAATNPGRAARLSADAERAAQSITDKGSKRIALHNVAAVLAATDPDRAERIAQSLIGKSSEARASALANIAQALAATDPDRAERIAQSITDQFFQAMALVGIVKPDKDRVRRVTLL